MLIQLYSHLRVNLLKFSEQLGKYMGIRYWRKSDFHRVLLKIEFIFEVRFEMFKYKQCPLGIIQENGPRRRQFNRFSIAEKQSDPHFIFQ